MKTMTKKEAYKLGYYEFPPPPVCTVYWDDAAWIAFIDKQGRWTVPVEQN